MRICHCTLGGTKACEHCSNNIDYDSLYDLDLSDTSGAYSETPPKPMTLGDLELAKKLIESAEKEREELNMLFKSFQLSQEILWLKNWIS